MNSTTLGAAVRRFPLLGRPWPSCPSLPDRVQEIVDIAHVAGHDDADGLADGASVLNKAALIASDCGLPDLAHDLCWQHIDLYRVADRSLTVLQARHMLGPVLNLARLQLRASDGEQALRLLTAMFQALRTSTDLVVDGRTLPLTDLVGTRAEPHKLREWVWLHLIGDGVRALVLAGRWDDAVAHAHAHRGVGLHLMEGRQAMTVAHCANADLAGARACAGGKHAGAAVGTSGRLLSEGYVRRPGQIAEYYKANGIPGPYEDTARRKIVPETLEQRVLSTFSNSTALFRKTSCAVSYAHGLPDYNGHYGVRELCDICPLSQLELCASAHRIPTAEDVHHAARVLPEADQLQVVDISERAAVVSGLDVEQPRYFLQHALGFQVHDVRHPHHANRHGRADIGWKGSAA
jgi:hypothetical protein